MGLLMVGATLKLQDIRIGSAHSSSFIEPVYVVPAAEVQVQQNGSGRSARLTQVILKFTSSCFEGITLVEHGRNVTKAHININI
jgi:hypothetical protein